jgi:ribosome modulation factor
MNSDLYGKTFVLPEEVVNYLQQCFDAAKGASQSNQGYRRNIELRKSKEVTYQQLKRMKNWFDGFDGDRDDLEYILNGGDYVKNWVNNTLESKRNDVDLGKEIKSVVLPNQYIDTHEKNDLASMNRPSKRHKSAVNKYDTAISENLKRINDLISKII